MSQIKRKFIADAAIDENKLASSAVSVTGALDGGSGTKLAVKTDGTTIQINIGDTLEVKSGVFVTTGSANSAGGYPQLDGGGKVAYAQLPSALMTYKGAWSPLSVGSPLTVLDATPLAGDTYRASVDGVAVAGNGAVTGTQFYAGDFAIYNGAAWERSPLSDGVISVNSAVGAVTVNAINQLTSDVTTSAASGSQSLAATIANNAVTNAKAAQMATLTIKGNNTGLTANASDLTVSDVKTMLSLSGTNSGDVTLAAVGSSPNANAATLTGQILNLQPFDSTHPGVVTASGGGTSNFLRADGTWASIPSAPTATEEMITLILADITAQFKDLAHTATGSSASVNSISLSVAGGPEQLKAVDYTVSLAGGVAGVTRITFAGDLATAGAAALVAGDILMVKYTY